MKSCRRKRRLAVGMVEMVEIVPGNRRRIKSKEKWELGCRRSVVNAGEVVKSRIIQHISSLNENSSRFLTPSTQMTSTFYKFVPQRERPGFTPIPF